MSKEQTTEVTTNDFFATSNLPDLNQAKAAPLELTGEYWTPESIGESRRAFFNELRQESSVSVETGETVDILVAYFVWEVGGDRKVFRNASRRLTGVLESVKVEKGTPLEITYLGKVKNKNNAFKSDNWSVKPLIIEK